jgi:hypothetical protein
MTTKVNLEVTATGSYFNHWPKLKIYHNNIIIADLEIINQQILQLDLLSSENNNLTFVHYGKSFGENNIWDKDFTSEAECNLVINDIKFDQVSIDEHLKSQLKFKTNWTNTQLRNEDPEFLKKYSESNSFGVMIFNGEISINYTTPVYNWLIINKYKIPRTEIAFHSNYSARWHYDKDLAIIKEIKQLINDQNTSN